MPSPPSSPPPVRASARVTGLLLAAGAGRRYGGPKALADDGSGPWVVRAARALLDGGCGDVLVVTGAAAEEVEALVAELADARVTAVRCGTWEDGMGESLRAGLTALATRGRTVPTQALTLLNNPFVVKQAEMLAERIAKEAPGDLAKQIELGYQYGLARPPTDLERSLALSTVKAGSLVDFTHVLFNMNEFLYMR